MARSMNNPGLRMRYALISGILPALITAIMLLGGCSAKRQVIKEPLREAKTSFLLDELAKNEMRFDWLSAKFSVDYIYDKKLTEFKGQIRIRKDSVIWVTFSPALGIEMARLKITTDSVLYINRINKTHLSGDYSFINDFLKTRIDFDVLHSIIIGNDFQFYDKTKFKAHVDKVEYKLSTSERRQLKKFVKQDETEAPVFYQDIWLDPNTFKITKVSLKEIKNDKKLEAYYSDFRNHNGYLFPYDLIFDIFADSRVTVKVNYSRIRLNEPLTFPFAIPEKYERIW
jgi:hypothetical protein